MLAGFHLPLEQGSILATGSCGADREGPQTDLDSASQSGHLLEIDWVEHVSKPGLGESLPVPSPGLGPGEPLPQAVPSPGQGESPFFRLCSDVSSSGGLVLLPVLEITNSSNQSIYIYSSLLHWGGPACVRSPPTPTHKTCLLSAVGDLK